MAAANDLMMPKLGLTMTEGVLAEWRVKPGDRVKAGDILFIVETDKIANEVEAPTNGEIFELLVAAGETAPVGARLAIWSGEANAAKTDDVSPAASTVEGTAASSPAAADHPSPRSGRIIATPLARRRARQEGIDLANVCGSGPRGRIKATDVEAKVRQAPASSSLQIAEPARTPAPGERLATTSKHRAMVERVTASKRDVPHFYVARAAKVDKLNALRSDLNAVGGPKITVTHLLLKAVGRALCEHPDMNRIWDQDDLVALDGSDVGMVVDTRDGLMIPILRDAGRMPLDQLAISATDVAVRAREGRLVREELEGGAISLSNIGTTGTTVVTPIISPPQAAILGVGAAEALFRPDSEGRPVLSREIRLTLSCDHRVTSGMQAARFLDRIAELIERPHALLRTA